MFWVIALQHAVFFLFFFKVNCRMCWTITWTKGTTICPMPFFLRTMNSRGGILCHSHDTFFK